MLTILAPLRSVLARGTLERIHYITFSLDCLTAFYLKVLAILCIS